MKTIPEFLLDFEELGSGANCTAYCEDGENVFLVIEGEDKTKDILCQCQGLPHIPPIEFLGVLDDGKLVYWTEYSETLSYCENEEFLNKLDIYGCSRVRSGERGTASIKQFYNDDELPLSIRESAMILWNKAIETFGNIVSLDFRQANLGVNAEGEILLRDILYIPA